MSRQYCPGEMQLKQLHAGKFAPSVQKPRTHLPANPGGQLMMEH
jgi:hypothetical protein